MSVDFSSIYAFPPIEAKFVKGVQKIHSLCLQQQWESAEELGQRILLAKPNHVVIEACVYEQLAGIYIKLGQFQYAKWAIHQGLKLDTKRLDIRAELLEKRAIVYLQEKNLSKAKKAYQEAVRFNPRDSNLNTHLKQQLELLKQEI